MVTRLRLFENLRFPHNKKKALRFVIRLSLLGCDRLLYFGGKMRDFHDFKLQIFLTMKFPAKQIT